MDDFSVGDYLAIQALVHRYPATSIAATSSALASSLPTPPYISKGGPIRS